jgi:hypothetical protein
VATGLSLSLDGRLLYGEVNPATLITSAAGLNDGQWHHVVVTRNSTSGAAIQYVDGSLAATATGPTGSLNAASLMGLGYEPNIGHTLERTIDEVAVYPTILTAAQMAYHYARGA